MKKFENRKVWFTSDLHFKHKNIIKYCNRPFENTDEMTEVLIDIWNKIVAKEDVVFILGDFCFGGYARWEEILKRLNGELHLILGNHDPEKIANKLLENGYLKSISSMELIEVDGQELFLCHFPMIDWPNKERGSIMLHGHIHSLYNDINLSEKHYDVGIDYNDYEPVCLNEIYNSLKNYKKPHTTFKQVLQTIGKYFKELYNDWCVS